MAVSRVRAVGLAAVLGSLVLVASGCGGGAEPDPGAVKFGDGLAASMKTQAQVSSAVDDLAKDPVVAYEGTLPGSATSGDVKLTVSRGGAALGSVDLDGDDVKVYVADGNTLIKAGKSYWDGKTSSKRAELYAGKWVKSASGEGVGFDPATVLKPSAIAQALRGTLGSVGTPVKDKVGDTDALRVPVVGGNIFITNKAPFRILKVDVPNLLSKGGGGSSSPSDDKGLTLDHLGSKDVDGFYDDMKGTDLSGALDSAVNFTTSGAGDLDCKTGGLCTASVRFSNSASGGKVTAQLNVTMSAAGLPTKKCSSTKSVSAGSSAKMSCKVNFSLAPSPHPKTYHVRANYVLSARASVDQDKINKNLDTAKKKDHDAAKKND